MNTTELAALRERLHLALDDYRDALPAGQYDAAEELYAAARAVADWMNLHEEVKS